MNLYIRLTSFLSLCFLLIVVPATSLATSTEQNSETPSWHQIEVIIFAQQDFYQAEAPRKDIILKYPDNWVMLNNSKQISGHATTNKATGNDESQAAPNPLSQLSAVMHNQVALDATPVVIEDPFQTLLVDDQTLSADAFALKRAQGYRVLFHEAWRQPELNAKDAPWVLITGGKQYGDHFTLEGSLRVYQSRHLHIQTNLWKVSYQKTQQTLTPKASQESVAPKPEEKQTWPTIPVKPQPKIAITSANQLLIEPNQRTPFKHAKEVLPTKQIPHFEPVEVALLKQSRKIILGQTQYLDHPKMGALILVTKHQPLAQPPESLE